MQRLVDVTLPPVVESARRARAVLDAGLEHHGLGDLRDTAALVVAELVGNAILHARSDFVLQVELTDRWLHVRVSDGSSVMPESREPAPATGGYGLRIVDDLADEWGIIVTSFDGKTTWATLSAPPPAPRPALRSTTPVSVN